MYLTDMAPNGTNDLLIVDGNSGELIEVVEAATFGYPRNTWIKPNAVFYGPSCFVGGLPESQDDVLEEYDTYVYSVDAATILKQLCVSPLDPNGEKLQAKLIKAGVIGGAK